MEQHQCHLQTFCMGPRDGVKTVALALHLCWMLKFLRVGL